jgi:hypothetical protein
MLAVLFYDVVVALHVMAILIAFGVIFTYPVAVPWMVRNRPEYVPALHGFQARVGQRVIAPAGGIALLLGIYLASDRHYWSQVWVTVPLVILLVLLAVGGAWISKTEERLETLARRDIGEGGGTLSGEYHGVLRTWSLVAYGSCALVLVAVFFMVAKP